MGTNFTANGKKICEKEEEQDGSLIKVSILATTEVENVLDKESTPIQVVTNSQEVG
jgi:hypothetical protein